MNTLQKTLRGSSALLDRLFALAGALTLVQFPGFLAHYLQQISGRINEAALNVKQWRATADSLSETFDQFIRNLASYDSPRTVAVSQQLGRSLARLEALELDFHAIRDASTWLRLPTFIRHVDIDIARATWREFSPNVPLNAESFVYALVGLAAGMLVYVLLKKTATLIGVCVVVVPCRALARRLRGAEPTHKGDGSGQQASGHTKPQNV